MDNPVASAAALTIRPRMHGQLVHGDHLVEAQHAGTLFFHRGTLVCRFDPDHLMKLRHTPDTDAKSGFNITAD